MDGSPTVTQVVGPQRRRRPLKGTVVKNIEGHVLTLRVTIGTRIADVSYFVEDITSGRVARGARPISVMPRDPEVPPDIVTIPPSQVRIIAERLARAPLPKN